MLENRTADFSQTLVRIIKVSLLKVNSIMSWQINNPINVGYTEYNIMRELNVNEIEHVNGGRWQIAVGAAVFKEAYETATFYGAGRLGRWLGSRIYYYTHR